jgi:nucleotidyltransferase/DNA polymerase involved in DNA repair
MDYFYAQIEERDNPELARKPVIVSMVSRRMGSQGAVATCNYIAREKGVNSGMPISHVKKIVEDAVIITARKDYYGEVSKEIMDCIGSFGDFFEQASIDEAYSALDDSHTFSDGVDLAKMIKSLIRTRSNLSSTAGVSVNKLLAKMASNHQKPDGFTVIESDQIESFIESLKLDKLHGIGPKALELLGEMGISSISELRNTPLQSLTKVFGKSKGKTLYDYSRGIDNRLVSDKPKEQIGRLMSFKTDTRDVKELELALSALSRNVFDRLEGHGSFFKSLTLQIITEDMEMRTRSKTLPEAIRSKKAIDELSKDLLMKYLSDEGDLIRRIGITVSGLSDDLSQKRISEY